MITDDIAAAGRRTEMTLAMLLSPPSTAGTDNPCEDIERCEVTTIDYAKMRQLIEETCDDDGMHLFRIEFEGYDYYAYLTGKIFRRSEWTGDGRITPRERIEDIYIVVDSATFYNLDGGMIGGDFEAECL